MRLLVTKASLVTNVTALSIVLSIKTAHMILSAMFSGKLTPGQMEIRLSNSKDVGLETPINVMIENVVSKIERRPNATFSSVVVVETCAMAKLSMIQQLIQLKMKTNSSLQIPTTLPS